jgi:alpha-methylacyl-CoA racemase
LAENAGTLSGIRVVELGGIGPGPFGAMMLADMGADVVRLDRPGAPPFAAGYDPAGDILLRGRRSVLLDLRADAGRELALDLLDQADAFIDPFRPGAAERLGLGPDVALERNPRLVYARMTGWGQDGPLAKVAGHDINYVGLAGPLAAIGRPSSPPAPPLNLVADFGGGGMLLALGITAALVERASSGRGQVLDVAMVDGVALQFAGVLGLRQMGLWSDERAGNLLDGGAPFYDTYETRDGRFVSVGALEPQFYAALIERVGLELADWPQGERERWPALRERLTAIFVTRSRVEWEAHFAGVDACFAPVLAAEEAASHPHNAARGTYQRVDGLLQPAPAPRFSRTPGRIRSGPCRPGVGGREALVNWGVTVERVDALVAAGVVAA